MKMNDDSAHAIKTLKYTGGTSMKKNILVVDDNQQNRKILCRILQSSGYDVIEADNGQSAIDFLNDNRRAIDLVLLDLVMPVMDGYAVLQRMNESGMITSIPVIVTTGNEDAEIRCLENGASDYLRKPYNAELVQRRVKSLLRLRDNAALINQLETDHLTGTLSKEFFYRYAQEAMDENPGEKFYIVYTDIDDFKMINARYGTDAGDDLLRFLAGVFSTQAGQSGLCGRIVADNFVMLLRSLPAYTQEQIGKLSMERFKNAPIKGAQLKYGIYAVVDRSLSVSDMCDRAKLAVASIKHRYGVHYAVYNDSLREKAMKEHQLADRMDEALEKKEFVVYFQPKHCTESKAVAGAEALVRWNHPELGFLSPDSFIPLFERNGFIIKLDSYMLREVCRVLRTWIDNGIKPIPVSVNVSRLNFSTENLPEKIETIVDSFGLTHDLVHLEITESAYTDHPQQIISAVTALREMGFLIEMDDFGSGYSSLNMLSELPINILKLDMRFIQGGSNRACGNKQNVLSYIISLSKWLQFPTVAEGVETEEEFDMLKSMGCNLVQGYYFAKPMPVKEFEGYILSHPETCKLAARKQPAAISGDPADAESNRRKPLILVADDIACNRTVMQELLSPFYRVETVENGKKACEFLARHRAETDCILLDLLMPVMDGFQVLEVMRANGTIDEIPVIITTETGSGNELRALHLGASSFVAKPYNPEILLHHVKKTVEEKAFWGAKRAFELEKKAFYEEKRKAELP